MSPVMLGLLLTLAMVAGTVVVGWFAVPVIGLAWGVWRRREGGGAAIAACAAAVAWGSLVAWDASVGPAGELARRVGGVMRIPGWAFTVLTILYPALLAPGAAWLGSRVGRMVDRRSAPHTA